MKTNKISQTQRPFSLSISFVSLNVLNCRPINHFIDKLPVDSSHNVISLVLLLTVFNPLTGTLKPQSNGPLYSNTVIGMWQDCHTSIPALLLTDWLRRALLIAASIGQRGGVSNSRRVVNSRVSVELSLELSQ